MPRRLAKGGRAHTRALASCRVLFRPLDVQGTPKEAVVDEFADNLNGSVKKLEERLLPIIRRAGKEG